MFSWKGFIELIKYGVWGVVSTGINLALFYLFIKLRMHYVVANVVSYIIAVAFSFVFNNKFVFEESGENTATKGVKFFLMRAASIAIDSALLMFFCEICGLGILISKVTVSVIIILSTFVISKFFIFKK